MKIAPYVPGKDSVDGKEPIAKLSSNEGALGPSPKAMAAYAKAAGELHRYPDGASEKLRKAIGRHYGLDPDRIICGAGSDEILNLLVRSYCGPGDELLYSQYGFLMYPINALGVGATPVAAPEKDYRTDVDAMIARITDKTRVVCLANPNNPTGSYVTKDDVRKLQKALPKNVLLVIDAAYAEYVERADYDAGPKLVDAGENTVMTRTFSKIFGLGGARLGWAYAPPAITDVLNRVRAPFNVSAMVAAGAMAALADAGWVEESRAHNTRARGRLAARLTQAGLKVHPSEANFLLVDFLSSDRAVAADAFLRSRGIIVRNVKSYGLPSCLRITIGTDEECDLVAGALGGFAHG
jgi:histidinol-phosphate aminotransferase